MKNFVILFIAISFLSCYQTERDCQSFKTGKFYSEVTIDGVLYTSVFERFEDLQVETYNDKSDSAQVRWINDCEVVFKTIHPKRMADHKDIHLKILTTNDSTYTFEYSYVGETKKQKGVAYKIH